MTQREEMSSLKRNKQQEEPPPPQSTVPDETLTAAPQIPSPTTCRPPILHPHSSPSDVILRLFMDPPSPSPSPSSQEDLEVSLHSDVLRRSNYFSTLLSDRWQKNCSSGQLFCLNLGVSSSRYNSFEYHLNVLHLFYTNDFAGSIKSVSTALSFIHVALELLFEECVSACVRFIEAVAWTEEEEQMVLDVIPLLGLEESRELRARVCVEKEECSEEMLHGMILAAMNATTDSKWNKDLWQRLLLEKLLRDFSSKDFVGRALSRAFNMKLSESNQSLRSYLDAYKVRDASQTTSWTSDACKVITCWKQMMWLVERVIELRVANDAAIEWSNNASLVAVLLEALSSKVWNFVATDLPVHALHCLRKLTIESSTGSILLPRQVRMNLIKNWLPFLIVCLDKVVLKEDSDKSLYLDLEHAFIKIISTLPLADSKDFLQQFLSFYSNKAEDCPHLVSALETWFRRASHPPQDLVPSSTTTPV